ncbi:hypothetical protein [Chicken picobirnavirus]|nr:hypothetical protein [Chicken picobirnavirus]AXY55124.1 hypothetical protein [Chicken picobirnavirus]
MVFTQSTKTSTKTFTYLCNGLKTGRVHGLKRYKVLTSQGGVYL